MTIDTYIIEKYRQGKVHHAKWIINMYVCMYKRKNLYNAQMKYIE